MDLRSKRSAFRVAAVLALVATPAVAVAASQLPAKPVLRVSVTTGGVVHSDDGRIRCPRRCSVAYKRSGVKALNAYPRQHFDFRGWSGSCFGFVTRCLVAVDQRTDVRARFTRRTGTLQVSVTGSGAIEVEPGGTIIRDTGSAEVPQGLPITLTPRPDAGSTLKGWAEECADAALVGCTITPGDKAEVAAAFGQATPGPGPRTLSVKVGGAATVTSTPAGIRCPGACSATFPAGTLVALRSSAPGGYDTYWEGGRTCSVRSYVPTCLLVLDASTDAGAFANLRPYGYPSEGVVLTVSGPGEVLGDTGDIQCGRHIGRLFKYCASAMDPRDDWSLGLSALPGRHARFGGWGGDCSGKKLYCTRPKGSYEVTAYFRRR